MIFALFIKKDDEKNNKKQGGEKMMKARLIVLIVGLVAFFYSYGFDLGGYTGPIELKFYDWTIGRQYEYDDGVWYSEGARNGLAGGNRDLEDWEYTDPDGIADSWGIITLTQITDSDGRGRWSNSSTEEITGVIWGFDDTLIGQEASGATVLQERGWIALYLDTSPDFNPDAFSDNDFDHMPDGWVASGPELSWDPWGATDGELFLLLEAVPGVSPLYPDATRSETVGGLTSPFSGHGSGYFKVIGGSYAWLFDSNAYNDVYPGADIYAIFNFGGEGRYDFDAKSSDPSSGFATPEPTSLLLLGGGLLGLAGLRIRRKKKVV